MTLDELLAKQEIRDTLMTYCRGIDRLDATLLESVYHEDATDDHGGYSGDARGFIAWVIPLLRGFDSTMHFLGNSLISVDGDTAHSETYAIAYHRRTADGGGKEDWTIALRYVDRFEQRNGAWKISHRVCVFEWQRIDPVLDGAELRQRIIGRRDATDPVYSVE